MNVSNNLLEITGARREEGQVQERRKRISWIAKDSIAWVHNDMLIPRVSDRREG